MAEPLAAVVMAGGIGTRMKSATPKHLHPLLGRRMVDWVVEAARGAGVERVVVVASPSTGELYDRVDVAVQEEPRGTGDADLYVSKTVAPTTQVWDCRPYTATSNERCVMTLSSPAALHILVRGYGPTLGRSAGAA